MSIIHFVRTNNYHGFKDALPAYQGNLKDLLDLNITLLKDLLTKLINSSYIVDLIKKKDTKDYDQFFAGLLCSVKGTVQIIQHLVANNVTGDVGQVLECFNDAFYVKSVLNCVQSDSDFADLVRMRENVMTVLNRGKTSSDYFLYCQLNFLADLAAVVTSFIETFGRKAFQLSSETAQKLAAFGFVFDDKKLFKNGCSFNSFVFCGEDLYNWDELLYTLMNQSEEYGDYFEWLFKPKLRSRIRRRMDKSLPTFSKINLPLDPRMISDKVVSTAGELFGDFAAEMLRRERRN